MRNYSEAHSAPRLLYFYNYGFMIFSLSFKISGPYFFLRLFRIPLDSVIGIRLNPEDIHIMHKSEYSGLFGDYSSYSAEYDELTEDAEDEEE